MRRACDDQHNVAPQALASGRKREHDDDGPYVTYRSGPYHHSPYVRGPSSGDLQPQFYGQDDELDVVHGAEQPSPLHQPSTHSGPYVSQELLGRYSKGTSQPDHYLSIDSLGRRYFPPPPPPPSYGQFGNDQSYFARLPPPQSLPHTFGTTEAFSIVEVEQLRIEMEVMRSSFRELQQQYGEKCGEVIVLQKTVESLRNQLRGVQPQQHQSQHPPGASGEEAKRSAKTHDPRSDGGKKSGSITAPASFGGEAASSWSCNLCGIFVNSETTLRSHLQGEKHRKALSRVNSTADSRRSSMPRQQHAHEEGPDASVEVVAEQAALVIKDDGITREDTVGGAVESDSARHRMLSGL